jgi:hypothetical protein
VNNNFCNAVIMVGLVACSRTPPAGDAREQPSQPLAERGTPDPPPTAQSAVPVAEEKPAPGTAVAADDPKVGRRAGGPCEYERVPGIGTVTAIASYTAGPDCKHAKRVTMSFAPDVAGAEPKRQDQAFTLGVGGVEFVAAGCLEVHKITVGTKLSVVRHALKAGTCSPLVYEVTALSSPEAIEKCVAYCG